CGAVMLYGNATQRGGYDGRTFKCQSSPGRRACGRNAIMAKTVIRIAHEWLPRFVNDDAALRRGVMREDNTMDAINNELRALAQRKRETEEDRALGTNGITRASAARILETIRSREQELSRQ